MEDLCRASLALVCTWIYCEHTYMKERDNCSGRSILSAQPCVSEGGCDWIHQSSNARIIATTKEEFSQPPLLVRGWFVLWCISLCEEHHVFTLSLISLIDLSLNRCCDRQERGCSFKKNKKFMLFDFVSCFVMRPQTNRPKKKIIVVVVDLTNQFVSVWSGFMAPNRERQLSELLSGCWNRVLTYAGKTAHCNAWIDCYLKACESRSIYSNISRGKKTTFILLFY